MIDTVYCTIIVGCYNISIFIFVCSLNVIVYCIGIVLTWSFK